MREKLFTALRFVQSETCPQERNGLKSSIKDTGVFFLILAKNDGKEKINTCFERNDLVWLMAQ